MKMNATPMREFNHFPVVNGEVGNGVKFERIRRITGYLVGTVDRWNDAKNRQKRLSRLASSPLFVALMLGLAVRAVLPLWVRQ